MKLVSFEWDGAPGYGAVTGDELVRLDMEPGAAPDLKSALATGQLTRPGALGGKARLRLSDVRLLPPIPNPGKILCVATNFHEPERGDKPAPDYPLLFTRFPESVTGHGSPILKPAISGKYDFEGELAVVIGKDGHHISQDDAMAHVAGFTCFNDGSVRDWQKHSTQFTPGKNFYRSGAMGPWLVTIDEIGDVAALGLETRVNGEVKQRIGMDRMIFTIPWLIAYFSTFTPLSAGDVIATGTPSGFGSTRNPPEFLSAGDVVEVEISGVGLLRNTVLDEQDFH